MKFHRPYVSRVMASQAGTVIELLRLHRKSHPHDTKFMDDLGRGWNTWIEYTLPDGHTITARPGSTRWDRSGHKRTKAAPAEQCATHTMAP